MFYSKHFIELKCKTKNYNVHSSKKNVDDELFHYSSSFSL